MSDICFYRTSSQIRCLISLFACHRGNDDVTQTALRAIKEKSTSRKQLCATSRKRRRHTDGFTSHRGNDDVTQTALRAIEETTTSHKPAFSDYFQYKTRMV